MIQKKALVATATLILALLGALGWAMHALSEANKEAGRLESELTEAVTANVANQTTITKLEAAVTSLKSRRVAEQARADAVALELQKEQTTHAERVQTLQDEMIEDRETDNDYAEWARHTVPDATADRLRRAGSRHRDPDD